MLTRDRAETLCNQFPKLRIAVVGDLMLDRYVRGHADRISPEAPVPVIRVKSRTSVLGGAANVLRNLASFKITPVAFGVIGADAHGEEFCELCGHWGIDTAHVLKLEGRQTTIKTRLIADNQQVARIDDERTEPLDTESAQKLLANLTEAVSQGNIDAIILEDYSKGVLTSQLVSNVQALAANHKIPCTLDPHPGHRFEVPGLTLMTPNRPESFAMAGEYYHDTVLPIENDEPLKRVAEAILTKWAPEYLLITLGSGGMALYGKDGSCHHIPTVAREVFDVSGAGDTVIATWTAALLAGATPQEACELANHAAGIVVGKIGTVCVEKDELLASFV